MTPPAVFIRLSRIPRNFCCNRQLNIPVLFLWAPLGKRENSAARKHKNVGNNGIRRLSRRGMLLRNTFPLRSFSAVFFKPHIRRKNDPKKNNIRVGNRLFPPECGVFRPPFSRFSRKQSSLNKKKPFRLTCFKERSNDNPKKACARKNRGTMAFWHKN